jgi:hypothetical protein
MPEQRDWRYCWKCHGLFFNGYPSKGRCPAEVSGGHDAIGYNFILPHNVPGTMTAQPDWEFCVKCYGMFFNGYPDKGRCPTKVDGGHELHPLAHRFVLPHALDTQLDLRPPDGGPSQEPLGNTQHLEYLGSFPAFAFGYLLAETNSAWEQAAVVYINGFRQHQLIGNYHHSAFFWLPEADHPRDILLAGWHKRSAPDGGQPWHPSRGRRRGEWAEWDDSGGDLDFNDLRVSIVKTSGIPIPGLPRTPGIRSFGYLATQSTADFFPRNEAVFLTSLANLKALTRQMTEGEDKEAIVQYTNEVVDRVVRSCCRNKESGWSPPLSQTVALAAELNLIANAFPDGDLRAALLELIGRVLQSTKGVNASC